MASISRWLVGSSSSSTSGSADQRAREQHATPPAARQRVDAASAGRFEPGQDQIDLVRALPRFQLVRRVELTRAVRALVRRSLGHDHVEDRPGRGQRHVLDEPRDAQSGLTPHRPRVGRQLAADDLQQRRLAGAVAADDRHPLAGVDLQRHIVEQRQMAEGEGDVIERDDGQGPGGSRKSKLRAS